MYVFKFNHNFFDMIKLRIFKLLENQHATSSTCIFGLPQQIDYKKDSSSPESAACHIT